MAIDLTVDTLIIKNNKQLNNVLIVIIYEINEYKYPVEQI
jgi:hypothetical protein